MNSEGFFYSSPYNKKGGAKMSEIQATQTREELSGLLTAISIVSKRLADNLKKLGTGKEVTANGQAESPG